ncbi:MAG: hypothetical protein JXR25_01680 [Pontiellaceae bacterium]|nr:hypothetical protein [Pontiellaceae bacterium]MBN2783510.1 hypothetical protein [Pontiellaceae bacterium]
MSDDMKNRRGLDFLLGFVCSLAIAILCIFLTFSASSPAPLVIGGAVLLTSAIVSFVTHRPMIGAGVLSMLLISPLLLIGSCFALFSFSQ